jgi:hypothetical protein
MKFKARIFVYVLLATPVFWLVVIAIQKHRAHDIARFELKSLNPAYAAKVEKVVASIEHETPSESVANLYYVNEFYNPGPHIQWVTPENQDQIDLDAIMSNRRFLKSLSELSKMDKAEAAKLVQTNLMSAITSYSRLYNSQMRLQAPFFKITTNNTVTNRPIGAAFATGVPSGQEDKEVLLGVKLKVFSLVWISGMLKLTDNKEQIKQVVRLAIKQRMDLIGDSTLLPSYKEQMLGEASLYNIQVLSSGLIGVAFDKEDVESNAMQASGIHWQQRKLAAYKAVLTEFDIPVQSGIVAPDYSDGSLTVKFVSPISDTNFDLLLQEIHFK